jgi:hypothetical protein
VMVSVPSPVANEPPEPTEPFVIQQVSDADLRGSDASRATSVSPIAFSMSLRQFCYRQPVYD